MLVPAICYREELTKKFNEVRYSEKTTWFNGCIENGPFQISDEPSEGRFQYAIVEKELTLDCQEITKVVGYLGFYVGFYDCGVWGIGLISFDDKPNVTITNAVREMIKIFKNYRLHRIEFRAIGGNPAVKKYDKILELANKSGNYAIQKITLHDVFKDRSGLYRDSYIYELLDISYRNLYEF